MLTIFSVPKAFAGHTGTIQRNAIRSWLALRPVCQVILFGDDEGVAATAARLGVEHVAGVECTTYGTPLLSAVFAAAERQARFPILCYVNADILLPPEFTTCVGGVRLHRFLMLGRRIDLFVDDELDFGCAEVSPEATAGVRADPQRASPAASERAAAETWASIRRLTALRGRPHRRSGIDSFVFPRTVPSETLGGLPPFAVGRPGWDNWMVYRARQVGLPVVDASGCVRVIHQDHDYGHVPGGSGSSFEGPEADANRRLLPDGAEALTSQFATWEVGPGGLRRRPWWRRHPQVLLHEVATFHPRWRPLLPAGDAALRLASRAKHRLTTSPHRAGRR